ncbi:MAG: peptidoglycan DD-metalloendopeptidase family protein [Lachnospiraceae bacterium]
MLKKKHKRKVSRIVIFTTDAVDAGTKQIRIHPWVSILLTLVICCLLGAVIGYAVYEEQIWELDREKDLKQAETIAALEEEKSSLEAEIETLNAKIEALSTAVNSQVQTAEALQEELEQQSLPTDYPLTGSAGIEEVTEETPMVIFTASEGITAVASAKGTVAAIEEDENYGNKITVDHGNGYISIYFNKGEAQVKVGDEVAKGTTLFLIGADNRQLVYQIMKDGAYITPTEMLSING